MSQIIVGIRRSFVGRTLRRHVPLPVKRLINRTVIAALPVRSRLAREVMSGIRVVDPLGTKGDAITPGARPQHLSRASRSPRSTSGVQGANLIFIASIPRSGTEAFLSLLRAIPAAWSIEEEFFSGYLRTSTIRMLRPTFPWIGDWRAVADSDRDGEQRESCASDYRNLMNLHALDVTEELLRLQGGTVFMKVFPHHLDQQVFEALVERWRPGVLVLRRRLIFSYVSELKASQTGSWFTTDNTGAEVSFSTEHAEQYIADADSWFNHVTAACERHHAHRLDLTFEDVVETDSKRPELLRFLNVDPRWRSAAPSTARQDRRTDASLATTLSDFAALPQELRAELLRLPGPPAP